MIGRAYKIPNGQAKMYIIALWKNVERSNSSSIVMAVEAEVEEEEEEARYRLPFIAVYPHNGEGKRGEDITGGLGLSWWIFLVAQKK